eukprot:gb/GECG01004144.1/.p1 GENE.gb/GECG01004144.1/~~gb/GECG01004144.1/.p1  ORF type:complete len:165 (+),score=8.98 gb/GECG01004144.1/:1-495(+)
MLSQHVMVRIDKFLRRHRKSDEPFGGIRIVLCGDIYQLPPVGGQVLYGRQGPGKFLYISHFKAVVVLQQQMRQMENREFQEVLEACRKHLEPHHVDVINRQVISSFWEHYLSTSIFRQIVCSDNRTKNYYNYRIFAMTKETNTSYPRNLPCRKEKRSLRKHFKA